MKNTTGCTINHNEKTVTITKAFAKAAGIYNSAEYNVMKGLRTDFSDYTIKQKEIAKSSSKKTYANLTYVNMRAYIETQNGDAMLTKFENVLKLSKIQSAPYAYVKKWFLETFKDYSDPTKANMPVDEIDDVTVTKNRIAA